MANKDSVTKGNRLVVRDKITGEIYKVQAVMFGVYTDFTNIFTKFYLVNDNMGGEMTINADMTDVIYQDEWETEKDANGNKVKDFVLDALVKSDADTALDSLKEIIQSNILAAEYEEGQKNFGFSADESGDDSLDSERGSFANTVKRAGEQIKEKVTSAGETIKEEFNTEKIREKAEKESDIKFNRESVDRGLDKAEDILNRTSESLKKLTIQMCDAVDELKETLKASAEAGKGEEDDSSESDDEDIKE